MNENDMMSTSRKTLRAVAAVMGTLVGFLACFALLFGYGAFANSVHPSWAGARFGIGVFKALTLVVAAAFLVVPMGVAFAVRKLAKVRSFIPLQVAFVGTLLLIIPVLYFLSGINGCELDTSFPLPGVWWCSD